MQVTGQLGDLFSIALAPPDSSRLNSAALDRSGWHQYAVSSNE